MSRELPPRANLEFLKKQAKQLLRDARAGDASAKQALEAVRGDAAAAPKLADAQFATARDYGFASWAKLKAHVEAMTPAADPFEMLAGAIKGDDVARAAQILAEHPQLKARLNEAMPGGSFGATPLLAAVHRGNRATVDLLLDAGADVNVRSHWWAGGFGVLDDHHALVDHLISRGAKLNAYSAAKLGRINALRAMIDADPAAVHLRGGDGQTPLHVAADVQIAQLLIDRGADIDAKDVDHESTPAQYAVKERPDVARLLVERGCKSDILLAAALGKLDRVKEHLRQDPACIRTNVSHKWFPMRNPHAGGTIYIWTLGWNKTPHLAAREFGHEEVFRFLMDQSPDELKLAMACEVGEEDTLRKLLAARPNLVQTLGEEDQGRIVSAAQSCNVQAVRLMLEAGWPVNARGQHGGTALHWAAFHGHAQMAQLILQHHPNLELTDSDYKAAPLGWAIHGSLNGWYIKTGDYGGVVEQLLQAGAKPPELDEVEASLAVLEVLKKKRG
ncbi:MAG TPA: ankyrin repeat domain-containing protein [Humisphaera sp.]|jgi:ankyrin repeat protein|nr:ankyrin repeat domain-containing protein [Humisphaera sp.]